MARFRHSAMSPVVWLHVPRSAGALEYVGDCADAAAPPSSKAPSAIGASSHFMGSLLERGDRRTIEKTRSIRRVFRRRLDAGQQVVLGRGLVGRGGPADRVE